jgi:hypothetical protein
MSQDFQIMQLELDDEALIKLPNRLRNQLVGCMHAHNELTVLNRILVFSLNAAWEEGDKLQNAAQAMQTWCLLQVLAGKLFETWNMLRKRFLAANPEDPAIASLNSDHRANLDWVKHYFGSPAKKSPLQLIRDRTAFHYDQLDLSQAMPNPLPTKICSISLSTPEIASTMSDRRSSFERSLR